MEDWHQGRGMTKGIAEKGRGGEKTKGMTGAVARPMEYKRKGRE